MKKLVNLKGAKALNRKEQKEIFGGTPITHAPPEGGGGGSAGNWACGCNSGVNITGVPSCNSSDCDWACTNQGGWNGACICVGAC